MLPPNARLRPLVVPQPPPAQAQTSAEAADAAGCETETVQSRPHRINWARLLKRVFDIDMQHSLNCGAGELKIIAAILERPVIEKILSVNPGARPCEAARDLTGRASRYLDWSWMDGRDLGSGGGIAVSGCEGQPRSIAFALRCLGRQLAEAA
ncbi:MAG: hypothetical protein WCT47_07130 [Betaproteobacteria bacterium]